MQRMGRVNRPYFRIVVMDSKRPQGGRVLENIGFYDPTNAKPEEQLRLDLERAKHWLSVGAQTTETMTSILKKHGLKANLK